MKTGSARAASLIFFVATVAVSIWAAFQYRNLQQSVGQQQARIQRQQGEIRRNAESLKELMTTAARQRVLLNRARDRQAVLEEDNRIGTILIARQGGQIARNNRLLAESQAKLRVSEERLATSVLTLRENEATLGAIQSANNYTESYSSGLNVFRESVGALCNQNLEQIAHFCRTHQRYMELMGLEARAIQARILAIRSRDYANMRASYLAVAARLSGLPDDAWTRAWRASAAEGVAYAEMKMRRLGEARSAIGEAVRLNPGATFVTITALKIMCVHGAPAQQVSEELSAHVGRITQWMADSSDSRASRYALELEFLANDAELYQLCHYAGIVPPSRSAR